MDAMIEFLTSAWETISVFFLDTLGLQTIIDAIANLF